MVQLMKAALDCSHCLEIFGTYTHAGYSYDSRNASEAANVLCQEVTAANDCARLFRKVESETGTIRKTLLKIAIGATPTAWASAHLGDNALPQDLQGTIEM